MVLMPRLLGFTMTPSKLAGKLAQWCLASKVFGLPDYVAQEHWGSMKIGRSIVPCHWLSGLSWVIFPGRIRLGEGRQIWKHDNATDALF